MQLKSCIWVRGKLYMGEEGRQCRGQGLQCSGGAKPCSGGAKAHNGGANACSALEEPSLTVTSLRKLLLGRSPRKNCKNDLDDQT